MDYTARIQELSNLKSLIVGKVVSTSDVDGFSSEVSGWEGNAPEGYRSLVEDTKNETQKVYETIDTVVSAIENRITELETLIENQYAANSGIPYMILDDDSAKNRSKQISKINQISNLDSSVRERLMSRV